jgi:hypothetical protein
MFVHIAVFLGSICDTITDSILGASVILCLWCVGSICDTYYAYVWSICDTMLMVRREHL